MMAWVVVWCCVCCQDIMDKQLIDRTGGCAANAYNKKERKKDKRQEGWERKTKLVRERRDNEERREEKGREEKESMCGCGSEFEWRVKKYEKEGKEQRVVKECKSGKVGKSCFLECFCMNNFATWRQTNSTKRTFCAEQTQPSMVELLVLKVDNPCLNLTRTHRTHRTHTRTHSHRDTERHNTHAHSYPRHDEEEEEEGRERTWTGMDVRVHFSLSLSHYSCVAIYLFT